MSEQPITITLTPELSARIQKRIRENGYESPVEVIASGLDALDEEDREPLESWMDEQLAEVLEELDRDPSRVRTSEQVEATLQAAYERALAAEQQEGLRKAG